MISKITDLENKKLEFEYMHVKTKGNEDNKIEKMFRNIIKV